MTIYQALKILGAAMVVVFAAGYCDAAEEAAIPPTSEETDSPSTPDDAPPVPEEEVATAELRTVLPDHRYLWFVYAESDAPKGRLQIWRVDSKGLTHRKFSVVGEDNEHLYDWDAYGDWIWLLTNQGVRRIGRLRPVEGKNEHFEPELINPGIIGAAPVGIVIDDSRIIIAGERGLFVFDRHRRQLSNLTDKPVKKLKRTPFGIVARTAEAFLLFDTSSGNPLLSPMALKKGDNWQEQVSSDAYVMAEPGGTGIVAITDAETCLSFGLDLLHIELPPEEELREACLYGGRLWLLTDNRLIALATGPAGNVEYDLTTTQSTYTELMVQGGALRCGPIAVRLHGDQFDAHVVSLRPGDMPAARTQPMGATETRRTGQ